MLQPRVEFPQGGTGMGKRGGTEAFLGVSDALLSSMVEELLCYFISF